MQPEQKLKELLDWVQEPKKERDLDIKIRHKKIYYPEPGYETVYKIYIYSHDVGEGTWLGMVDDIPTDEELKQQLEERHKEKTDE